MWAEEENTVSPQDLQKREWGGVEEALPSRRSRRSRRMSTVSKTRQDKCKLQNLVMEPPEKSND